MTKEGGKVMQQNQKFEFDLFSLPHTTLKRLEQYVQECIAKNEAK